MLYDLGLLIFSIFYIPYLVFKGKMHRDIIERFGIYNEEKRGRLESGKDRIWIQAVSVGEVALLRNFIPQLKREFPGKEIVLSTITKTGQDLAKKFFSPEAIVIYFPVDFGFVVKKTVDLIKPACYIMVETEIWPNLIETLSRRAVPLVLINGRVSDRSYGKYRLVKRFLKKTLSKIGFFCMQSKIDKERIIELGAAEEKVRVTGNIKFDVVPALKARSGADTRELLGLKPEEKLFVAGSTHPGEDEISLDVFRELINEFHFLRLLIAPRHIDRVGAIERLVKAAGFKPARVSMLHLSASGPQPSSVLILDTIGQLNDIYSIADAVFIGGSLVRHGGHNPIEPAVFGKAILFGPHMFNFRDIAKAFLSGNAAVPVTGRSDLASGIRRLLKDGNELARLSDSAKRVVAENRGAATRDLDAIKEIMR